MVLSEKYEKEINGKKVTLEIFVDEDPVNPREWEDNMGTMLCFHRHYNLGDKNVPCIDPYQFDSWDDMEEYLRKEEDAAVILPLYLYDHGGITIRTRPYNDPWDSGQVGFIYVTRDKILNEYGRKKLSKKLIEKVKVLLQGEVETYRQYLEGDVYGYRLSEDDVEVDSCWGFYGNNIRENGMLDQIPKEYAQVID